MNQHSRFPGSWLLVAAILALPSIIDSIAHSIDQGDERCDSEHTTVVERTMCE